jgi:hypothetical protein
MFPAAQPRDFVKVIYLYLHMKLGLPLGLREEHRLSLFENKMLERIFNVRDRM